MSKLGEHLSGAMRKFLGAEVHLFLAYSFIVFRPGATPPQLPIEATTQPRPVPTGWTADEHRLFIEEARADVVTQQADKRDIRTRAQIILTTAIVLGGTLVNSYSGKNDACIGGKILYGIAAAALCFAVLGAGGIISARSDIGTVSVPALTHYNTGELQHVVAEGYATTRQTGAQTISGLVTVLRDCVLTLVVGAALLAVAHVSQ